MILALLTCNLNISLEIDSVCFVVDVVVVVPWCDQGDDRSGQELAEKRVR